MSTTFHQAVKSAVLYMNHDDEVEQVILAAAVSFAGKIVRELSDSDMTAVVSTRAGLLEKIISKSASHDINIRDIRDLVASEIAIEVVAQLLPHSSIVAAMKGEQKS